MNNVIYHYSHQHGKKYSAEKRLIPHNSRNIISILFDEVNLSEEKFEAVKKDMYAKHHFHFMPNYSNSYDVFNQNT